MYNQKRKNAIASYILIIFFVSIFMTILLVIILGTIYVEDPQECNNLDFNLINICRTGKGIEFDVTNKANSILKFQINDVSDSSYQVPPREMAHIKFYTDDTIFKVVPVVGFASQEKMCNSKTFNINKEEVIKVC